MNAFTKYTQKVITKSGVYDERVVLNQILIWLGRDMNGIANTVILIRLF